MPDLCIFLLRNHTGLCQPSPAHRESGGPGPGEFRAHDRNSPPQNQSSPGPPQTSEMRVGYMYSGYIVVVSYSKMLNRMNCFFWIRSCQLEGDFLVHSRKYFVQRNEYFVHTHAPSGLVEAKIRQFILFSTLLYYSKMLNRTNCVFRFGPVKAIFSFN